MRIFRNLPHEPPEEAAFPVVTLGVFDGLHRGHQRILGRALELAAGRAVALLTFDPHPRAVLGPPKDHRLLTPIPERLDLLAQHPIAAVGILRFDQEVARIHYADFVRRVLVGGFGARLLVVGHDLRLGRGREGTPETIAALGPELGFEVDLVPPVEVGGEIVSSTRIRHRLDTGDVEGAARLLGRPYRLRGTVIRGDGRGRALGIPTANLEIPSDKLVPANGVYAVRSRVGGRALVGALNVGVVPTFHEGSRRSVEVHLLDFDGDLYGSRLEVELLGRIRDERRFAGPESLVQQIREDLAGVRESLASRIGTDDLAAD